MSGTHILETRPTKHTRLSSDNSSHSHSHSSDFSSTPSASNLQRHPEIWFDDGNIILIARRTAFCIYRGLLASQSTVFSDMFASSTSSSDEAFDGCPVVHLSVSPHDLGHLLRVLLPKSHIQYHTPKANTSECTFDEVSTVICLAHKYDIQQVQDQALAYIQEHCYTSDFDVYSSPPTKSPSSIDLLPVHAIGTVNLACLTDMPSILPLVLCQCAFLGSALLNGWTREDGTVEHLAPADLRQCLDGRVVLAHEHFFFLSYLLDDTPSTGCKTRERCVWELHKIHQNVTRSETPAKTLLMDWRAVIKMLLGSVCQLCVEELLARDKREREKLFDKLPEIFGITIEGWGVERLLMDAEDERDD